ncbi:MAG: ABC transporter ATP-binding protein [Bacteroidota bacterium]
MTESTRVRTGRRLLTYLKPYRRHFVLGLAAMILAALVNLSLPYVFGSFLIDRVLGAKVHALWLHLLAGGIVVVFVFRGIFLYLQHYLLSWVGQRVVVDLRNQLFQHLQCMPLSYHESRRTGETIARVVNDVSLVQTSISNGLADLLSHTVMLIGSLSIALLLHWRLTLLTIAVFPLVSLVVDVAGKKIRRNSHRIQEKAADLTAVLQETMSGIRIVKAFTMERHEAARFARENEGGFSATIKSVQVISTLTATIDLLFATALAFVMWYGGMEVLGGRLKTGELVAFFGYIAYASSPVMGLTRIYSQFQQTLGAGDRIFEVLDSLPETADDPDARPLPRLAGLVEFRGVKFSYDGGPPVLKEITLTARPGEVVALVGPSGAGKTSLVNLIPRFYDPDAGQILVDGHDIRTVQVKSLRSQIGLVPQETILFGVSIRENIAYGRPDAAEEEIIAAAKAANAHDFIMSLPAGYETLAGERGTLLSGGQRQRIAIARALLRDPRILILDEATSALDTESEYLVQDALERLMRERTTFVIAHRLSTIQFADRIVVLDKGRIVEEGTHERLLAANGLYRKLFERQFEDMKCEEDPV